MEINYPKQVQIFISDICDVGCKYCPYASMTNSEKSQCIKQELSVTEWMDVISYFRQKLGIKFFTLIGGEPVNKKNLSLLIQFVNEKFDDVEILLSTSGIPLLRNEPLEKDLIEAGVRNFAVSIDGMPKPADHRIDIEKELNSVQHGSEGKSFLGLYFLLSLKRKYPDKSLRLSANCIINRKTINEIIPLYNLLSKNKIFLNLCPEQTSCFKNFSQTAIVLETSEIKELSQILAGIKSAKNNYLVPSKRYLELLPIDGVGQMFRCAQASNPSTLHISSDGSLNFCNWRKGIGKKRNVMELVSGGLDYSDWISWWGGDSDGRTCSCSWSFLDRVNEFRESELTNFWYQFV